MVLDPATLVLLGALGGGASTLATLLIAGLVFRYVYRSWMDFDKLRDQAVNELRAENAHLRELLEEARNGGQGKGGGGSSRG